MTLDIDTEAKKLFEAMPHRHPTGHIPNWDFQPERIKDVFRNRVRNQHN